MALFETGSFGAALVEFKAADAIVPNSAIAYNIGVCLERLGRDDEALETYERYVAQIADPNGARAADVRARITALKARLGRP